MEDLLPPRKKKKLAIAPAVVRPVDSGSTTVRTSEVETTAARVPMVTRPSQPAYPPAGVRACILTRGGLAVAGEGAALSRGAVEGTGVKKNRCLEPLV